MAFWNRKKRPPEVRLPGRATVLEVGSSVVQTHQNSVSVRLRLRVRLPHGVQYEVTTAWTVQQAQLSQVQAGGDLPVDVAETAPAEVHPRDGWAAWDRTRTPQDPKVRWIDHPVDDPDPV